MSSLEQWRRYGEARRKALIEQDEQSGGTSFHINRKCRIDHYFALAERVTLQFRRLLTDPEKLEESFVMGHRLVRFLESALPKHPEYHQLTHKSRRLKCHHFLQYIYEQLEQVALAIDELQLDAFMDLNFDPAANDSLSSAEADDDPWESFGGWRAPGCVETDTSSRETSSDEEYRFDLPEEQDEFPDPDIQFYGVPLGNDSIVSEEEVSLEHISSFLLKIANEDVIYETDSEAEDSWAQKDDESLELSSISEPALTCDPARIAFQEILNQLPRSRISALEKNL